MPELIIPRSQRSRHRDRHGRGLRGPLLSPGIPAWKTRAEQFDDAVAREITTYQKYLGPRLTKFDFAVMDVPQQDPAPWEDGVPLGRFLPFERPSKIHGRILFYRMPIIEAASKEPHPALFLHQVVTEQIALALGVDPEEIDYL